MNELTIYILCHNRPDDAKHAIDSVMKQRDRKFSLVVSDNSSNDEVGRMVKTHFPDIGYVRRLPMLPALDHFNRCIEENKTEYFCLFHDDDLMGSEFVEVIKQSINKFPSAIAFACNAHIEMHGKLAPRPSFRSYRNHEFISTSRDLATRYFARAQSGIAPFPSYVYNSRIIGDQRIPIDGGKYADVTWLLGLVSKAPIVWINKALMTYRMHESNDGSIESMRDRLRFLRYLKQHKKEVGLDVLEDYRCSFIYKKISKANDRSHLKRHKFALSFLKKYRLSRYTRLGTYRVLLSRALIKIKTK